MFADYGDHHGAFRLNLYVLTLLYVFTPLGWSQCFGSRVEYVAETTYKTFTSVNYPQGYFNDMLCTWILKAEKETNAIQIQVLDSYIEYHPECLYDRVEVFDGNSDSNISLGYFCGTFVPSYVSSENYMLIKFTSDYSLISKGFRAQYKSGPRDSLLDKNEEKNSTNIVAIVAGVFGTMVVVVILIGLLFAYIKSAKAKRNRNRDFRRNNRREHHSTRIDATDLRILHHCSFYDPPPPPSYGDLYESPSSPPPAYSEDDPHPERSNGINNNDSNTNGGIFTVTAFTPTTNNYSRPPSCTSSTFSRNPRGLLHSGNERFFSHNLTIPPVLRALLIPSVQEGTSSGSRMADDSTTSHNIQCTNLPNQVEFVEDTTVSGVGQTNSQSQATSQTRGRT